MPEYTKEERKQILKALKTAQKLLWNGETWYIHKNKESAICDALYFARLDGKISRDEHILAKDMIGDRIGNQGWYITDWLRCKHGIDEKLLQNSRQVQRYRKRWLKALIKEFSK